MNKIISIIIIIICFSLWIILGNNLENIFDAISISEIKYSYSELVEICNKENLPEIERIRDFQLLSALVGLVGLVFLIEPTLSFFLKSKKKGQ